MLCVKQMYNPNYPPAPAIPPTQPVTAQPVQTKRVQPARTPNPKDLIEIRIKMPREYYDTFSAFAKFLHSQPAQHPQTGQPMIDPKTNQPIPALAQANIETYFMTCAIQTYQGYQMVLQMVKQREQMMQAAQGQQPQPQQQ